MVYYNNKLLQMQQGYVKANPAYTDPLLSLFGNLPVTLSELQNTVQWDLIFGVGAAMAIADAGTETDTPVLIAGTRGAALMLARGTATDAPAATDGAGWAMAMVATGTATLAPALTVGAGAAIVT